MDIDDIKLAIAKDSRLPEEVKNTLKQDLNNWLSKIGELYLLSPKMEVCSVGLNSNRNTLGSYIEITNIFRLHTILGVKLYATKYGEQYMIYCNALGYGFMELVSETRYISVYKSISEIVSEFTVFHPYSH